MSDLISFFDYGFGEYIKGQTLGPHCWPHFDLFLLHEGRVELTVRGEPLMLCENQGVLLYPHTPFSGKGVALKSRGSIHHFSIYKNTKYAFATFEKLKDKKNGFDCFTGLYATTLHQDVERAIRLAHETDFPQRHELRVTLLQMILLQLSQAPHISRPHRHAKDIRRLIEQLKTVPDFRLSVKAMAMRVNLSPSRFRVVFKACLGISPINFMQKLRMDHACRLLRETRTPIKAIAYATGYTELTHFYRAFKQACHTSPAKYREQQQIRA